MCHAELLIVALKQGPHRASVDKGLDCLRFYHWGLQIERSSGAVVQLLPVTVEAQPARTNLAVDLSGQLWSFSDRALQVNKRRGLAVLLPRCVERDRSCGRMWDRQAHGLRFDPRQ